MERIEMRIEIDAMMMDDDEAAKMSILCYKQECHWCYDGDEMMMGGRGRGVKSHREGNIPRTAQPSPKARQTKASKLPKKLTQIFSSFHPSSTFTSSRKEGGKERRILQEEGAKDMPW